MHWKNAQNSEGHTSTDVAWSVDPLFPDTGRKKLYKNLRTKSGAAKDEHEKRKTTS